MLLPGVRDDWIIAGEWDNIPMFIIDSWNGIYNNTVTKELCGDFLRVLQFTTGKNHEYMYLSTSSEQHLVELLRDMFRKDAKAFHKIMDNYYKQREKNLERMREIAALDLRKLSNKELLEVFRESRTLVGYSGAHDWFSFGVDRRIIDIVELDEYFKEHPEEKDAILNFTSPDALLTTIKEEIELLSLAKKAKGLSREGIKKEFEKELAQLSEDFGWLSALIYYPIKNAAAYAEEIHELSQKDTLDEELEEKENYTANINKALAEYIKEKQPPQKVIDSINAIRKLSEIRAVGEMDAIYGFTRFRNIDKEIQSRFSLSQDQYYALYLDEVEALLKGRTIEIDYDQRFELDGTYRDDDGKFQEVEKATELFARLQKQKRQGEELKGMPGCPGTARGTVRIIRGSNDIGSFKEGDILVAKATCVDYVVIMKKAGAIVTEYGGITSHAAVVSRELGVPSVIGVPNVTELLKEGERVEVDADKGAITRIE